MRNKFFPLACCGAALCLTGALMTLLVPSQVDAKPFPPPMFGTTISGLVEDSNGDPVAGIEVALDFSGPPTSTTTDANGNFTFTDLNPGTYTVSVCDGDDSKTVSLGCCEIFIVLTASCV